MNEEYQRCLQENIDRIDDYRKLISEDTNWNISPDTMLKMATQLAIDDNWSDRMASLEGYLGTMYGGMMS